MRPHVRRFTIQSWYHICTVFVAIQSGVSGSAIADAATPPGIVTERPAAGRFVETDAGYMVPYTETIPGTEVAFEMVPVPGGEFLLGSPDSEADRGSDEGPQVRVRVAPYWIGKTEVTWAEYQAYMKMYHVFKMLQRLAAMPIEPGQNAADAKARELIDEHAWNGDLAGQWEVDAVTTATPLYDASFTYGVGDQPNQPAVTMTQFAARQYTKWLSGITGREFRLPTEAEWEYAARAGTTTAYSFGDDPAQLKVYGWFDENGDYETHPVASKKPNPWGLYDVHGNVGEWTLDQYDAGTYEALGAGPVDASAAVRWPTKLYPRVIRGGSWLELAPECRSAARQKSDDEEWKLSDPNLPLSPWWYTEEPATGVGMRIVRPLAPMSVEEKRRVWDADIELVREDVRDRLQEGRGALGRPDLTLPAAAKAIDNFDAND
jgi:formylglycine-generating enzyme required for sulfatase activity